MTPDAVGAAGTDEREHRRLRILVRPLLAVPRPVTATPSG